MKPSPFEYLVVDTVEEAVARLAERGAEAKLLAGGQSLVPLMNMRLARPACLIDLNPVQELDYIVLDENRLRIGAMTRHRNVEASPLVRQHCPLLSEAIRYVGHPPIRNRGTVGGSVAHADPAAEVPAVTVALDAEFVVVGPRGERRVPADRFFLGPLMPDLEADELLREVSIPLPDPETRWAFLEVSRRRGDFALAGVAVRLRVDEENRCRAARIVLFGVGSTPVCAEVAEKALLGRTFQEGLLDDVTEAVRQAADPRDDVHASAGFRRHLAGTLARRALTSAWQGGTR